MRNFKNALKHINEPIKELQKTDLATQKIELSVAGDVKKANSTLSKVNKSIEKNAKEIRSAKTKAVQFKGQMDKIINKYKGSVQTESFSINPFTVLREAEQAAKDFPYRPHVVPRLAWEPGPKLWRQLEG
jgi:outer membrane murein-binding lipoprotein Lpp